MNGIEKITTKIVSEADAEIAAVLKDAEERAAAAAAEFARQAKTEEEAFLQAGRDSAEERVQRQARTARLEAKKQILALKQELVAAAYDKAKAAILALPQGEYAAFLARQAGEAARTGREEIILSREDRDRLGAQILAAANERAVQRGLPGELRLSGETCSASGGLVLRQGNVEVNCTLDKLLEMSRGSLDAEVASVLFG